LNLYKWFKGGTHIQIWIWFKIIRNKIKHKRKRKKEEGLLGLRDQLSAHQEDTPRAGPLILPRTCGSHLWPLRALVPLADGPRLADAPSRHRVNGTPGPLGSRSVPRVGVFLTRLHLCTCRYLAACIGYRSVAQFPASPISIGTRPRPREPPCFVAPTPHQHLRRRVPHKDCPPPPRITAPSGVRPPSWPPGTRTDSVEAVGGGNRGVPCCVHGDFSPETLFVATLRGQLHLASQPSVMPLGSIRYLLYIVYHLVTLRIKSGVARTRGSGETPPWAAAALLFYVTKWRVPGGPLDPKGVVTIRWMPVRLGGCEPLDPVWTMQIRSTNTPSFNGTVTVDLCFDGWERVWVF
jgi:hypothetical protein